MLTVAIWFVRNWRIQCFSAILGAEWARYLALFAGEGLVIGAAHREQGKGPVPPPVGELAQVQRVGLAGQATVLG
jgi:hypothetical protein